ncbi:MULTISPECIES: hypothetical protein [Erysipelotrichaceae]|uniref:hypothetical protein n=1 Tax=Erysipelotrichaceae TaxID=128827 RepID=UPI000E526C5D|nr:hypothetical protein [Absiella sp. AM27-20]RHU07179.1 hypothetical protein DW716_09280 [Absiella sp. AM27-20]DAZ35759.1 MAG TPA: head closure knob [Caudoviricetes sp.]
MLSKNTLVKMRKAIERMYDHTCDVIIKEEYEKPNHSTGMRDKTILSNQPCRISFSTVRETEKDSKASKVVQSIKLFIAPEIKIPPGSKILVLHDGIESLFSNSGEPATYPTHQEISLELFKGWA